MGATKLMTAAGGGITLDAASTASDKTITVPADNGTLVYANSSGNVNIGTSTTFNSSGYGTVLNLRGSANAAAYIGDTGAAANCLMLAHTSTVASVRAEDSVPLAFGTGGSERARIDTSGNLLVGCTSFPAVGTGGSPFGVGISSSASMEIISNGSSAINLRRDNSDGTLQSFRRGTTVVGSINVTSSATSYVTSSDYRLKENIAPMTGALSVVQQLKPCTYNWKVDGSDGQGFIAHELAEVVPDAVVGEKDAVDAEGNPVYQGIDTSFLVATLTAAIQELKAELDAAKADIAALKGTA